MESISRRNFKNVVPSELTRALESITDWNAIYNIRDINDTHDFIVDAVTRALDLVAPLRKITVKRGHNTYLARDTLAMMDRRDSAAAAARSKWSKTYRWLRNRVCSMVRRDKLQTNLHCLNKSGLLRNPKVLWQLANDAMGKTKCPLPASLHIDGRDSTNDKEAADATNAFFISKVEQLRKTLKSPASAPDPVASWPERTKPFQFTFASAGKVAKTIRGMRTSGATGVDGIPVSVLKMGVDVLASPIAYLVNNPILEHPVLDLASPILEHPVLDLASPILDYPVLDLASPILKHPVLDLASTILDYPVLDLASPILEHPVLDLASQILEHPVLDLASPILEHPVLKMAKLELVPELEVMSREEMMAEHWNLVRLARRTITVEQTIQWLAHQRLLANTDVCERCLIPRSIRADSSVRDNIMWRCPQCNNRKSIHHGSFYSNSTYCWCKYFLQKDCNEESGGMAKDIQIDWANFHRDICAQHLLENPTVIGGVREDENGTSTPVIVEIDESLLAKAKYNRGRWPEQRWIVMHLRILTHGACSLVYQNRPSLLGDVLSIFCHSYG
eukprot:snap_masked-scaffold915_size81523-processed-gene-0.7 protein:Tk11471 transcript:snap_masked-scaffold915_size81523-processed-gene-0.7-mRNA-1 annotation:"hypothetical protein TcasGA2_TC010755"